MGKIVGRVRSKIGGGGHQKRFGFAINGGPVLGHSFGDLKEVTSRGVLKMPRTLVEGFIPKSRLGVTKAERVASAKRDKARALAVSTAPVYGHPADAKIIGLCKGRSDLRNKNEVRYAWITACEKNSSFGKGISRNDVTIRIGVLAREGLILKK